MQVTNNSGHSFPCLIVLTTPPLCSKLISFLNQGIDVNRLPIHAIYAIRKFSFFSDIAPEDAVLPRRTCHNLLHPTHFLAMFSLIEIEGIRITSRRILTPYLISESYGFVADALFTSMFSEVFYYCLVTRYTLHYYKM